MSSSKMGTFPDFVICGIQKGGTSALFSFLRQHPQIFMPDAKEINYFNLHHRESHDWYAQWFSAASSDELIGEASPLYMWDPDVALRLHSLLPAAKLIFILRDPVERAYSNYWFNRARGAQNPDETFLEAVQTDDGRRRYLSKGFYDKMLERYWKLFPRHQLRVVVSQRLRTQPQAQLRRCFDFIGVTPDFTVEDTRPRNVTKYPRNWLVAQFLYRSADAWKKIMTKTPEQLKAPLRGVKSRASSFLFRPPAQTTAKPALSDETKARLRDVFSEDYHSLTERIGFKIPEWNLTEQ